MASSEQKLERSSMMHPNKDGRRPNKDGRGDFATRQFVDEKTQRLNAQESGTHGGGGDDWQRQINAYRMRQERESAQYLKNLDKRGKIIKEINEEAAAEARLARVEQGDNTNQPGELPRRARIEELIDALAAKYGQHVTLATTDPELHREFNPYEYASNPLNAEEKAYAYKYIAKKNLYPKQKNTLKSVIRLHYSKKEEHTTSDDNE